MKICVISDVHGKWNTIKVPECDVLISCGDYSFRGELHMVKDFHRWLDNQDAKYIISVQGNHELLVEKNFQLVKEMAEKECPGVYFIDEGLVEIEGVKIWCSAITPWFHSWAWNRHRGQEIKKHWDRIPNDIDILVTHGPPAGILDVCVYPDGTPRERVGCQDLRDRIAQLPNLKHHFFGHIHESYGHEEVDGVHFWNASICDERYMSANEPVVIEIKKN